MWHHTHKTFPRELTTSSHFISFSFSLLFSQLISLYIMYIFLPDSECYLIFILLVCSDMKENSLCWWIQIRSRKCNIFLADTHFFYVVERVESKKWFFSLFFDVVFFALSDSSPISSWYYTHRNVLFETTPSLSKCVDSQYFFFDHLDLTLKHETRSCKIW